MYKIGILEDDKKMGSELKLFLESNGYDSRFIEPAEYVGITEDELIDKLKEKFTAEGYALESDNTNGDMRTARFEGRGQSFAIVRSCLGNQHFIGITIPLVSG